MSDDQETPADNSGEENGQVEGASAPIIDWEAASELLGGDREFHCVLLESAISEISALRPKLHKALIAEDTTLAHRLAHTMKGAARAVAAVRATQAAAAVEKAASESEFLRAIELLPRFDETVTELGQEMEANRN